MTDQREGGIGWTDFTTNPLKYINRKTGKVVWGCEKVSPGCANCYAETLALRYGKGGPFTLHSQADVKPYSDEKELNTILTSQKITGRKVFPFDMTDLFGPWVPFELIDVFVGAMALRPDVNFQVLTKRPDRMYRYLNDRSLMKRPPFLEAIAAMYIEHPTLAKRMPFDEARAIAASRLKWPLDNVWWGVSIENSLQASRRRHPMELLADMGARTWISYEPALEWVNFDWFLPREVETGQTTSAYVRGVRWIVIGGESGPNARWFDLEWARRLIKQGAEHGVPIFVKQLGSKPYDSVLAFKALNREWPIDQMQRLGAYRKNGAWKKPVDWPIELRVQNFPLEMKAGSCSTCVANYS